ncbi:glycosyltransferase [Bacillus sp. ISL-40]|uniref:glycosyltransferase n=1 Tax=unclassified Bacillus (in: firmicutes) TaxID=185979 RepID=UPI001BEB347D|nr:MULTISPECIES: glycosyltransferase [unclassified Bacillus (in: firmicutes)]MBT2697384.1 glycosyltransferase [Bacillus sp. ISL-40]MBT2741798.1 glycosyltransferase [Bacillus sp. ISL-77]
MKKFSKKFTLLLLSIALILPAISVKAAPPPPPVNQKQTMSESAHQLKFNFRRLWMEHGIWTRSYIVSAEANLKDQQMVLTRLLKNQDDLGNAIKPFYGEAAGTKLAQLLREDILLAGKVLEAAKANNQVDLQKYNTAWYKNADDIAAFLSSANPNWNNTALKQLLHAHLKMITQSVLARLKNDWNGDIRAFDEGEIHLIKIADVLSDGIIKQFPQKF